MLTGVDQGGQLDPLRIKLVRNMTSIILVARVEALQHNFKQIIADLISVNNYNNNT